MDQIGWEGRSRSAAPQGSLNPENWPEVLEPRPDVYTGEAFLGPWA